MTTDRLMLILAVMLLIEALLTACNIVILGLAVKLYFEATKTHIFTTKGKGI